MNIEDFEEVPVDKLRGRWVAVDTECTGLHPWGDKARWGFHPARPFAFSFCDSEGQVAYERWDVNGSDRGVRPEPASFQRMQRILSDRRIGKVLHNARYDLRMLVLSGFDVSGPVHDTLVLAHVATGGSELAYGLKQLSKKFVGIGDEDQQDLKASTNEARRWGRSMGYCLAQKEYQGRDCAQADYWLADRALCKKYAVLDAIRTMALFQLLRREVRADRKCYSVYRKEMKLFWLLWRMENRGVRVRPDRIKELKDEYADTMARWEKVVEKEGASGLNFRSPKQMAKVFYEDRGHEPRFTEKGNLKVNKDILHEFAGQGDRLAEAIEEWRVADQTVRTFLNVYDRLRTKENGCWVLHPNFRQSGTSTGRLSCSEPNLLTVASETTGRVHTKTRPRPRYAFGPREGHVWLAADFSQMEVIMFAFLAKDPLMTKLILTGEDFHDGVCHQLFHHVADFKKNRKYYRKRAKVIMFCKLYGGGVNKIASLIPCPVEEAREFVYRWEQHLPNAVKFMEETIQRARADGMIRNPFGRKYYYVNPELAYTAVNHIVQGTGADILKNSLLRLDRKYRESWPGAHVLLPVHDEIVSEVPRDMVCPELVQDITDAMQADCEALGWPMKIPVDVKMCDDSWSSERKVEFAAKA